MRLTIARHDDGMPDASNNEAPAKKKKLPQLKPQRIAHAYSTNRLAQSGDNQTSSSSLTPPTILPGGRPIVNCRLDDTIGNFRSKPCNSLVYSHPCPGQWPQAMCSLHDFLELLGKCRHEFGFGRQQLGAKR